MHEDVRTAASAGSMVYGALLARAGRRFADKVALQYGAKRRSYAELDQRATQFANALRARGVSNGDRVAVLMRNRLETVEAYFAILRLGAVVVPINSRLTAPEIAYILNDCGASLLIVDNDHAVESEVNVFNVDTETLSDATEIDVEVAETAPAFIMYTSGTTGRPKGAVLAHRTLVFANLLQGLAVGAQLAVHLVGVPLFHIGGVASLMGRLANGDRVVLAEAKAFDPVATVDLLERERITTCFFVPAQWEQIVAVPGVKERDLALRMIAWGAAPASPQLLTALSETFPEAPAFTVFGQTETCGTICLLHGADALRKPGSIGKPIPGVDVRIVDDEMKDVPVGEVGEIVYRGPTVTQEYWGNPDATAAAYAGGWFHSGDLCRMDDEGFIWVVDRKTDMIISGGENIYCAEVEAVLGRHPGVAEVAVIGVPHEKWGQTPVAVITATDPANPPTLADIQDHCQAMLASYKKPTAVHVVEHLPRNATGKVLKNQLRERFTPS